VVLDSPTRAPRARPDRDPEEAPMRRPVLRLASCALAGAATLLVLAPAASADPGHEPGRELPEAASSASLHSPAHTHHHGRKL
jgi:hypothetical protein